MNVENGKKKKKKQGKERKSGCFQLRDNENEDENKAPDLSQAKLDLVFVFGCSDLKLSNMSVLKPYKILH